MTDEREPKLLPPEAGDTARPELVFSRCIRVERASDWDAWSFRKR